MSIYPPTGTLEIKNATLKVPVVDLQYTSNTAKLEANSNVVTEFSRSKKLIKYPRVALTSAAQSSAGDYEGYIVNQSSVYSSESAHGAYKSFRGNEHWLSSSNSFDGGNDVFNETNGPWISIQLPTKIKLEYLEFSAGSGRLGQLITAGSIYASNNGSTWINIGSLDNLGTYTNVVPAHVDFTHTTLYDRYLLHITANGTNYVHMEKLSLFGTPETDPEAHGTDVTIKSYPNIPNTDWLEVYYDAKGLDDTGTVTTVNDLKPVGTAVNGVVNGNPQISDGAFTFDGSADYIEGTFSGHTLSSGYTMATWIKPGEIGADDYIATFGVGNTGTSFGINFETVGGAFRAFIWGSSSNVAKTGPGAVTKNEWVHIAATFISATGSIHLYIDNKLVATGTGTTISSISASGPLILGARNSNGTIQRHANFTMANFRLFNRALTSDEIYQLYAYQKEYFGHGELSMTLKAGRLGIGTSEPRAMLDVRGDIRGGCPVYFQAKLGTAFSAGLYNNSINGAVIPWDQLYENTGCYNTTTGLFTAPMTAVYKFGYGMRPASSSTTYWTYIQKNGVAAKSANDHPGRIYSHTDLDTQSATFIMDLRMGDTVGILLASSGSTMPQVSNSYGYFHGHYFGESRGQHNFWD